MINDKKMQQWVNGGSIEKEHSKSSQYMDINLILSITSTCNVYNMQAYMHHTWL